jgi:hypothetical protein
MLDNLDPAYGTLLEVLGALEAGGVVFAGQEECVPLLLVADDAHGGLWHLVERDLILDAEVLVGRPYADDMLLHWEENVGLGVLSLWTQSQPSAMYIFII